MKKEMKVRIMTTLMAGTLALGFIAVPASSHLPAAGTVVVHAAEVSTGKKDEISYKKARKIALKDAGLDKKDVTWYETHKDFDDDRQITTWDLSFFSGDIEYDYDINAVDGEIVEKSSESMDAGDKAENQQKAEALKKALNKDSKKNKKNSKKKNKDVTEEKALEIALNDAGISAKTANVTKKHLDSDDGVSVYDIEFTSGDKEYEYEINAKTGAIQDKGMDSIYDD